MKNSEDAETLAQALSELQGTDAYIARVTEDLITLLIEKNTIRFTDLPKAVQEKLLHRERLRERVRQPLVSIISDDDTI